MPLRAPNDERVSYVELQTVENTLPVAYCFILSLRTFAICISIKKIKNSFYVMQRHHHPCKL